MVSAYRSAEACPRCGSDATASTGECGSCGHLWGAAHACVHCGICCGVEPDPELGVACTACAMPRGAPGWQMPQALATSVRAATVHRRATRRLAWVAFVVATLCVPLGPLLLAWSGVSAWLACLALWFAMIALTANARGRARRRLQREVARVRAAVQREADASTRPGADAPPRVRIVAVAETRLAAADAADVADAEDAEGAALRA